MNQKYYGFSEFKFFKRFELADGVLPLSVIFKIAGFSRDLHLEQKKKHLMATWWTKEIVRVTRVLFLIFFLVR